jgi:cystathionine gamma-lyase
VKYGNGTEGKTRGTRTCCGDRRVPKGHSGCGGLKGTRSPYGNRINKNGIRLARFLEAHPKIEQVIYPALESHPQHELAKKTMSGFPGLFCFVPAGGIEKAEKLYRSLNTPEVGPSWGGFETIMNGPGMNISPERAEKTGISPGQIRISVGLEDIDTIIGDFSDALDALDR